MELLESSQTLTLSISELLQGLQCFIKKLHLKCCFCCFFPQFQVTVDITSGSLDEISRPAPSSRYNCRSLNTPMALLTPEPYLQKVIFLSFSRLKPPCPILHSRMLKKQYSAFSVSHVPYSGNPKFDSLGNDELENQYEF